LALGLASSTNAADGKCFVCGEYGAIVEQGHALAGYPQASCPDSMLREGLLAHAHTHTQARTRTLALYMRDDAQPHKAKVALQKDKQGHGRVNTQTSIHTDIHAYSCTYTRAHMYTRTIHAWYTLAVTHSSPMFMRMVASRSKKVGMASMRHSLSSDLRCGTCREGGVQGTEFGA